MFENFNSSATPFIFLVLLSAFSSCDHTFTHTDKFLVFPSCQGENSHFHFHFLFSYFKFHPCLFHSCLGEIVFPNFFEFFFFFGDVVVRISFIVW